MLLKDYLLSEFIIPAAIVVVFIVSMTSCPKGFGGDAVEKPPTLSNNAQSIVVKEKLMKEQGASEKIHKIQVAQQANEREIDVMQNSADGLNKELDEIILQIEKQEK